MDGLGQHLARHHGCRKYVPICLADLKLFWFSSVGPFGLLWGRGCICRWGAKKSCYG